MKTVIISDPKITVINGSFVDISSMAYYHPGMSIDFDDPESPTYETVKSELIKARRFRKQSTDGKVEFWGVGFDEKTCEALNLLPTNERADFEACMAVKDTMKASLKRIKSAGFWTRLKWLIGGVK